ncbi:hypothetical protein C2E23DRAFT_885821 [Lenzites betulinus]|nr:hypothetical protein C2E23DRAFT_885821 [Lenzites betulinus]
MLTDSDDTQSRTSTTVFAESHGQDQAAVQPNITIAQSSAADSLVDQWKVPDPQGIAEELRKEFSQQKQFTAQAELDNVVKTFHDGTVKRWIDELDTLLVYAGLFSAVLTAFNVESYRLLQPDDAESVAVAIGKQMAIQLSQLTADYHPRGAIKVDDSLVFNPPSFVIWVNCLWFSSLVTSIASASIALMIKQWLYESSTGISGSSRASTQLLQYRMDSLKRWHVHGITAMVPLLLQIALILFLIGLVILLWNLHRVVAAVTSAFVGTLFLFLITVTITPTLCGASRYAHATRRVKYNDIPFAYFFWSKLQTLCDLLSHAPGYRTWEGRERFVLRRQSAELNNETAIMAYTTTLDPAHLDNIRVALAGEDGQPLLRCLNALGVARGTEEIPTSFMKRSARAAAARIVLYALRQVLAVRPTKRARTWEGDVRTLLNTYTTIVSDGSVKNDDTVLQTTFLVLLETVDPHTQYAALKYLANAVDSESSESCEYSIVSHVLAVVEQWIDKQRANQNLRDRSLLQTNTSAFNIVLQCMLRVVLDKTTVPKPEQQHFQALCDRARDALSALPDFLPDRAALVGSATLCNQLAYGLKLLLKPLIQLSHGMDAPHAPDTAPHIVDTPSPITAEVVNALEEVWDTAWAVISESHKPHLPPPVAPRDHLGITRRLEEMQREVNLLFNPFGMQLGPR